MKKKTKIFLAIIITVALLLALNQNTDPIPNSTKILKEGTIDKNDKTYSYQLLRLEGKNEPSYAVYIQNDRPETVFITKPYTAIDWTEEKIDQKQWNPQSIEEITEESNIYLYNGFSVLNVFGRFYTEGDIENDINDMLAGMNFLSNKTKKIGITGMSWGGFEAIYTAANSNPKPIVGVAYYPPTDFQSWRNWAENTNEDFFTPYIERIDKTTQGNFTSWSHDYLAANLETKFLIIHAHEDTLVPIEQSISLSKLSDKINLLTLNLEKGKLSHGEQSQDILPIEYSIAPAYLMRALTKDNITIIVDKKAIEDTKSELVKNILLDEQIIFLEINENRILSKEEIQELLTKNQTN
jgi:hypothetical protein